MALLKTEIFDVLSVTDPLFAIASTTFSTTDATDTVPFALCSLLLKANNTNKMASKGNAINLLI